MPIIKSAKKRVKVAKKATIRNSKTKRSLKSALKSFVSKPAGKTHSVAQSNVDKAVKKGLIHKNKAARIKKQLSATAKSAGAKPEATNKKTTAKPAVKKAAPAKKAPVAKKPATKKPAAKKAPAKK